ncbi:MAG TPA: cupredoxin domain-containing protein [Chloroflexota bacterium]
MKQVIPAILFGAAAVIGIILHVHQASAGSALTVNVTLRDYRVMVAQHHFPVGKPITFMITNRGHHTHEFVLEAANAFDKALRYRGTTYEAANIKPGTTRTVTWTIPNKGTYKLACHIDHHYQMGMKTLITAVSP